MAERIINRGGKNFRYSPGNNSSYIAIEKDAPQPMTFQKPKSPAKVISTPFTSEDPMKTWSYLNKRKSKLIPPGKAIPVASQRG